MPRKYSILAIPRHVYCSSSHDYVIEVMVSVRYGSKFARQQCNFILCLHNEWWERAPKYLRREMWQKVFKVHDGTGFKFVEYDSYGNPRYENLRYADAEQFASTLELYREELK